MDLLSFQFDRYGGGFCVEIARCPPGGVVTSEDQIILPAKLKVWDLNPSRRRRIVVCETGGKADWFRFDRQPPHELSLMLLERLEAPNLWDGLGPYGLPNEQRRILKDITG
jgi:hypothetical protein